MKASFPSWSVQRFAAMLAAATLLVSNAGLRAQTAVSNLNQTWGNTSALVGKSGPTEYQSVWSFTTGSSAASFDFSAITIAFTAANGTPTHLAISLNSGFDSDTETGAIGLLADLTLSSGDPTTAGNASFTSGSTVNLAANTTYYLRLTAVGEPTNYAYYYKIAHDYDEDSGGLFGWSLGDSFMTSSSPSSWSTNTFNVPMFSVQAVAVPEPATYALVTGLAILGCVVLARRWRRGRAARGLL